MNGGRKVAINEEKREGNTNCAPFASAAFWRRDFGLCAFCIRRFTIGKVTAHAGRL